MKTSKAIIDNIGCIKYAAIIDNDANPISIGFVNFIIDSRYCYLGPFKLCAGGENTDGKTISSPHH